MYELIQAGECSYYVNCPSKIGIYRRGEGEVFLIDSGSDKDAGRKVKKLLDAQGWTPRGIINTHSHADHVGGNRYLQQQYGCPAYAAETEVAFIRHPELEPALLGGVYPISELKHKFLMAQPSEAVDITHESFPGELELIDLPGHCFQMIGVRTPDGTVFLADSVASPATLEKYKFTFMYDVAGFLRTLDKLETLEGKIFVPSHADPVEDVRELTEVNRRTVYKLADAIVEECAAPVMWEELLCRLFTRFDLSMTPEQYVLVGSTLRSYLSWLKESGRLELVIEGKRLLWKAV